LSQYGGLVPLSFHWGPKSGLLLLQWVQTYQDDDVTGLVHVISKSFV